MTYEPTKSMMLDEVNAYRDSVDALLVVCLERIRVYPLGPDVEPAPAERPAP
jgi:hypothetical protein